MIRFSNEPLKNHIGLDRFFKKLWIIACIPLIMAMMTSCTQTSGNAGEHGYDAPDPVEVVRGDYMSWLEEDYTISMNVLEAVADDGETQRMIEMYKGSDLAESRGWEDEYLDEHFAVVKVIYECEFDHTKTFMADGLLEGYVFLTRDPESGVWTIVDRTSPSDIPTDKIL